MIDFRYHIVSLVAVFLALAVGLVLGTTALNQPILDRHPRPRHQLARTSGPLRTGPASSTRR